jgi:CBS domain containing-hemolysin-like protein
MIGRRHDLGRGTAIATMSPDHVPAPILRAGFDLDPRETRIHDVMTPGPATVSVKDTEEQAIKSMRARHVRRLPIVDANRVVGMLSIDDVVLAGAADLEAVADIVEAQLAEPATNKPSGLMHPTKGCCASGHA